MKQNFLNFPEVSGKVAIIIRHAERDPIEFMTRALEAQLTANGKADAFQLGQSLARYNPINIYHSPVPRCIQTAESIFEGIVSCNESATIVGYLLELGGPYITSTWDTVVNSIEKFGNSMFIRKWFDNELPSNLIMPLPDAAHIQLNILVNQLRSGISSSINITHDWNIMILREYYFNLRHEDIGDPEYLDGMYAYLHQDRLHLRYHGRERILDLSPVGVANH
jgi:Histidine phosphatase superfamily (branch 1)